MKLFMFGVIIYFILISSSFQHYLPSGNRGEYISNAITEETEKLYNGNLGCYLCSQLMMITKKRVDLSQNQLQTLLNSRCSQFSTMIRSQCYAFIKDSLPQIYFSLSYDMSQNNICEILNICDTNQYFESTHESKDENNDGFENKFILSTNKQQSPQSVARPIPIFDPTTTTDGPILIQESTTYPPSVAIPNPSQNALKGTFIPSVRRKNTRPNASSDLNPNSINFMIQQKPSENNNLQENVSVFQKPKTVVYVPSDIKSSKKIPEFEDLTHPLAVDKKGTRMTCAFCQRMLNNARNYAMTSKAEISSFANNTCAKLTKSNLSEQCYKLTDRKISELANFVDEQVVEALWCAQMNNC